MSASITSREFFTQAGIPAGGGGSPAIIPNMGRFENVAFASDGGVVAQVDVSLDHGNDATPTWILNVGALGTAFPGGIVFKGMAFKAYRVVFTGTLYVNAN